MLIQFVLKLYRRIALVLLQVDFYFLFEVVQALCNRKQTFVLNLMAFQEFQIDQKQHSKNLERFVDDFWRFYIADFHIL